MKQESVHARQELRDHYSTRGLDTSFPQLKPYLFPKARVLDVGCGPGTITLDVAKEVYPGQVFGIDPVEESIEQANQGKAERKVANITFQVGQAQALNFPDDTFDVVYSHATFQWIPDPVQGLVELKRVTRKEGWVVCTLAEKGVRVMYPPCPMFDKVIAIQRDHWNELTDPDHYYDGYIGRRAVELLKKAGFEKLHIEQSGLEILHAGEKPVNIESDLHWLDYEGPFRGFYDKLFSLGVLEEETIIAAQTELKNWAHHPYAFRIRGIKLIIAGQA